jgi:molybdopterin converting factor small subunit
MNKFQGLINYFNDEPIIIQLVWMLSCLLFVAIIVLIIYIKFLRKHLRDKEKVVTKYSEKNELLLITYLYAENEEGGVSLEQQEVINKLKRGIANKFKREIIVSTLLKLRNEISGEMAEAIQDLYSQITLKNFALAKLKNEKWDVIAEGIRELTLFQVKEAHDEVVKHVNHSKKEVRKEVQLYLVSLFNFEGLIFLNDLKTPLSEWDQIQFLGELQKIENQQIPDISLWLKSTNDYVVIFALKLAKIYNQFGMKDVLIEMLTHKSEKVRSELLSVLSNLYIVEAKDILKSNFSKRSKDEQLAFFELLNNLADNNDEDFIVEHTHHENFEIKLLALKTLKNLNIDKFRSFDLIPPESEFVKIIIFVENN